MLSNLTARQQHFDRWRASGLSRAAYCREHGLVYHTTRSWTRPVNTPQSSPESASGFIEVLRHPAVITAPPAHEMATVSWTSGATLRVPIGTDPQWIGRIIAEVHPC